ncbi:MAG: hypothetical protein LBG58_00670 [Planctomycetaceae bacterium]|jgi:hypothetical protein|nr:hypothetical protein [Planctomycetaceae bacterium]
MSDPLQLLNHGDPIRATMLNAVIDGAKIAKNLSKTGAATGAAAGRSNVLVRILNATGEDLERFAVAALSEPIFEPENNETAVLFFRNRLFATRNRNPKQKKLRSCKLRRYGMYADCFKKSLVFSAEIGFFNIYEQQFPTKPYSYFSLDSILLR